MLGLSPRKGKFLVTSLLTFLSYLLYYYIFYYHSTTNITITSFGWGFDLKIFFAVEITRICHRHGELLNSLVKTKLFLSQLYQILATILSLSSKYAIARLWTSLYNILCLYPCIAVVVW